jgi:hypothetical protein
VAYIVSYGPFDFQLILLDAKEAFDTVVHSHMLRRVFLAGIDNRHWTRASSGISLIRAISSAHAVLLTLMLPIFKPNPDPSTLSESGR